MFGNSEWKKEVTRSLQALEQQVADLRKSEQELRAQNHRLHQIMKNLGRKLVSRLPISIESLEKGLSYDLIFAEEIGAWKEATREGLILDVRPAHDAAKFSIPDALNIPYDQLSLRIEHLPKSQAILIVCDNGIKSVAASELLTSKGYGFIYVLKGGMNHYRDFIDTASRVTKDDDAAAADAVREARVS